MRVMNRWSKWEFSGSQAASVLAGVRRYKDERRPRGGVAWWIRPDANQFWGSDGGTRMIGVYAWHSSGSRNTIATKPEEDAS